MRVLTNWFNWAKWFDVSWCMNTNHYSLNPRAKDENMIRWQNECAFLEIRREVIMLSCLRCGWPLVCIRIYVRRNLCRIIWWLTDRIQSRDVKQYAWCPQRWPLHGIDSNAVHLRPAVVRSWPPQRCLVSMYADVDVQLHDPPACQQFDASSDSSLQYQQLLQLSTGTCLVKDSASSFRGYQLCPGRSPASHPKSASYVCMQKSLYIADRMKNQIILIYID